MATRAGGARGKEGSREGREERCGRGGECEGRTEERKAAELCPRRAPGAREEPLLGSPGTSAAKGPRLGVSAAPVLERSGGVCAGGHPARGERYRRGDPCEGGRRQKPPVSAPASPERSGELRGAGPKRGGGPAADICCGEKPRRRRRGREGSGRAAMLRPGKCRRGGTWQSSQRVAFLGSAKGFCTAGARAFRGEADACSQRMGGSCPSSPRALVVSAARSRSRRRGDGAVPASPRPPLPPARAMCERGQRRNPPRPLPGALPTACGLYPFPARRGEKRGPGAAPLTAGRAAPRPGWMPSATRSGRGPGRAPAGPGEALLGPQDRARARRQPRTLPPGPSALPRSPLRDPPAAGAAWGAGSPSRIRDLGGDPLLCRPGPGREAEGRSPRCPPPPRLKGLGNCGVRGPNGEGARQRIFAAGRSLAGGGEGGRAAGERRCCGPGNAVVGGPGSRRNALLFWVPPRAFAPPGPERFGAKQTRVPSGWGVPALLPLGPSSFPQRGAVPGGEAMGQSRPPPGLPSHLLGRCASGGSGETLLALSLVPFRQPAGSIRSRPGAGRSGARGQHR
ncbi:PREDICTED: translation initiation factor IF-2-like [Calidris pugnax]|uniref:translation initiation factor IF-2-like n=1 Tax=Calidris pugnax TaxID=198806 RepID=UPI00071CFC7A|nr:PREDICTED: translation initiation factor IF-2-like [Calidris pugnax]